MKTSKRIFHILLSILLLHGSTVGYSEKVSLPKASQHEENIFALPSAHVISYSTKQESGRYLFNSLDAFSPGGDGTFLSSIYRHAELNLCDRLSTSLLLSTNHILNLQNTTIVFPFHYFP